MTLQSHTQIGSIEKIKWAEFSARTQLVIVSARSATRGSRILHQLRTHCPQAQMHLATSCQGMMTERHVSLKSDEIALMTYEDPESSFGTAGASLNDPEQCAAITQQLLHIAELRASRAGELPSLVWMSATPGSEEKVIETIRSYFQSPVLICGGSPADDDITGKWWVGDQSQIYPQGIVISLIYTASKITTRFSAGYQIADIQGLITSGADRLIRMIDHRPAAEVYNEWCQGSLDPYFPDGNILEASTFQPLAISCGAIGLSPYYRVLHPERIHEDGAISTFSNVKQGERIVLLSGDRDSLVGRARRVARGAILDTGGDVKGIRGALVIFCAGCFLAIKEHVDLVWEGLTLELPDVPMLGQFTFGEQGVFPDGEVAHGNLMVTVVLWSDADKSDSWLT